jgi:hypothetical protein
MSINSNTFTYTTNQIEPTPQPTEAAPLIPLSATNKFDILLKNIYEKFVSDVNIISLYHAFDVNNGESMTIEQYDNILNANILYWINENFIIFQQNTKVFLNFCVQDYVNNKFFVSYVPSLRNLDNLITDTNDPNYGANGYRQWLGNYIATKPMVGSDGKKYNTYQDVYKFSSVRSMQNGYYYETRGLRVKARSLNTTYSSSVGTDVTFMWQMAEIDTTIKTKTKIVDGNKVVITAESNIIGQTKYTIVVYEKMTDVIIKVCYKYKNVDYTSIDFNKLNIFFDS